MAEAQQLTWQQEAPGVWSATVAALGTPDQLAAVPDWHRGRYEAMNKYIEVLGAEDPSAYACLTPAQAQTLAATDRPFANLRLARRWALTRSGRWSARPRRRLRRGR